MKIFDARSAVHASALALLAALLLPGAGSARDDARELHWRELAVSARLEADGTLRISETQAIVFTGDWNGGERRFNLRLGQSVQIDRIVRIDPATGRERELTRGDLGEVDHYDWTSSDTVRWRSRRPSDPPFAATEIDYRLEYRTTGILVRSGGAYSLAHDFVFPDRDGAIEHLRIDLALAPEWMPRTPFAGHYEAGPLAPGNSYVVRADLDYRGAAPPKFTAPVSLPAAIRESLAGAGAAVIVFFAILFVRRERALGRLGPLAVGPIDEAWLRERVLAFRPEEIGAAWDRSIGQAEVAATLARLVQEKKLSSEIRSEGWLIQRPNLHLKLLVPRDRFSDYESSLISALFFSGDETDSQSIRKHYASSGFDPASKIRKSLEAHLAARRAFSDKSEKPRWKPTGLLALAGVLLIAAAIALGGATPLALRVIALVLPLGMLLFSYLSGLFAALVLQSRVTGLAGPIVWVAFGFALGLAALGLGTALPGMSIVGGIGVLLLFVAAARSVFDVMATREGAESIRRRRELVAARDWFAAQLRLAKPVLEDAWFPYLIAFGLARAVDRWFHAFGAGMATAAGMAMAGGRSGGSLATGSTSGWTGGGGSFGGGGASASWAVAASAMSAGVASASSGGGGGGGGGGGSSGGGGGGGW